MKFSVLMSFGLLCLFSAATFASPPSSDEPDLRGSVEQYLESTTRLPITLGFSTNFSRVIDRDEIWTLSNDFSQGISYLADRFILGSNRDEQSVGERLARLSGALLALTSLEASAAIAAHEYGHFREFSLVGLHSHTFFDAQSSQWIDGGILGVIEVAVGRAFTLGNFPLYSATVSDSDRERVYQDPRISPYQNYTFAAQEAAGFNQQQYHIEKIAERVLDGKGHIFDVVPYSIHLVSHMFYPQQTNSDVADYVNWLGTFSVTTSSRPVQYYSQIPKLFSNSFLSLWRGIVGYVGYGEERFDPISWDVGRFKIYWPEFVGHLTVRGPTIGIEERLDCGRHALFGGLEKSIATDDIEMNLGWRGAVSKVLVGEARVAYHPNSGGVYIEVGPSVNFKINRSLALSLGALFYYGKGYTFRRDFIGQNLDFLSDDEYGVKGFLSITIRF